MVAKRKLNSPFKTMERRLCVRLLWQVFVYGVTYSRLYLYLPDCSPPQWVRKVIVFIHAMRMGLGRRQTIALSIELTNKYEALLVWLSENASN